MNNLRLGTPEVACAPLRAGPTWRPTGGDLLAPLALFPGHPRTCGRRDPSPATRSAPSVQPALALREPSDPRAGTRGQRRAGRVDGGDARSVTSYGFRRVARAEVACAGVKDAEACGGKAHQGVGPPRAAPLRLRRAFTGRLGAGPAGWTGGLSLWCLDVTWRVAFGPVRLVRGTRAGR